LCRSLIFLGARFTNLFDSARALPDPFGSITDIEAVARHFRRNQQSINAGRQQWETVAPALAGYLYAALSELPRDAPYQDAPD
jgi:hypothetical protein